MTSVSGVARLGGTLTSYEQVTSKETVKSETTLLTKVSVLVSVVPCLANIQALHMKEKVPEERLPLEPTPVKLRSPSGLVRVVVPSDGPKVMDDDENPV